MSEFEKKVFKINQTEKIISSFMSGWKNYYDSFTELREELIKTNWRERNPILAVCGFVASVLLGFLSIGSINMEQFQIYLAVDGIVALLVFVGYGLYNFMLMKSTLSIEKSFIGVIGNLEGLRNHYLVLTYDIDSIHLSKLEDFAVFAVLAEGSSKIRMYNELSKFSKLKRLPKEVQNEVSRSIQVWMVGIENSIKSFEEIKEEFEKEEWKDYRLFIQDLIDFKK